MTVATISKESEIASSASVTSDWAMHMRYLLAAWAGIMLFFWRDVWTMVTTWWNISTYNHCLLIVPIIYWLVHQRRDELLKITPRIWAPGLLWIGVASVGWMLGEAAGVTFAKHLGIIMMLQGAVVTLLGSTVARGLIFPIAYSFFLVPFGEELVPFLQTVTAKMSMVMLGWANIPAFIDGIFISTPTGYFEVAEACSGIKFLIAMVAYGTLVGNVCFQSWNRRILFMLASIIVPVIANGIRAFGTIYIAHHTSVDFASGFDHIFYGWFFFAFVLALVMLIGWPFFDRKIDDQMINGDRLESRHSQKMSKLSLPKLAAIMTAVIVGPMFWISVVAAQSSAVPDKIELPKLLGWEQVEYRPMYEWQPQFTGASHTLLGRYQNLLTGEKVDLSIAVYDKQEDGREIVGYGQGGLVPGTEWAWNRNLKAPSTSSAIQITAPGPVTRDIVSFYRIGGVLTGSGSVVKLKTLKAKLLGGNQQAVAVLVSSEKTGDPEAMTAIENFLADLGPVDKLADEMAGLR
ncbi:MAG: exosortase A [Parasphingorhabdus sp.]